MLNFEKRYIIYNIFLGNPKLKLMRKILLFFAALSALYFVRAEVVVKPATYDYKDAIKTVLPDSAALCRAKDSLSQSKVVVDVKPTILREDSVATTAPRDSVLVADSLRIATDSLTLPEKVYFKSVVIRRGGRDRSGKFTEECAAHANALLWKRGIRASGHAYQMPSFFHPVMNGYFRLSLPKMEGYTYAQKFNAIMNFHRRAADYIKKRLDISQLDPKYCYVVNMYYNTSKYMVDFYYAAKEQGTRNYGTHVGVVYYDAESQDWVVEHNIHGNVHRDSLHAVLGGRSNPHKYGVTTIYRTPLPKR